MMARKITESQNLHNLTLVITPQELDVGQFLQIAVAFTDKYAQPVIVPEIYMEILDSVGRVAWEKQVMERNSSGFVKLISTRELQTNTRYTIRISKNSDMSNHRFGYFKTTKKKLPLAFIPLLLSPLMITPLIPKNAEVPVFYIYRTELDGKVCDKCSRNEGKKFKRGDPNLIRIGPPELGGETHWRCRCHYDITLLINPAYAKVLEIHRMVKAVSIVNTIKRLKTKEILT